VFSTTLRSSEWNNTRVVDDGLEDEIRSLKKQPGRAVNIQGSASIVQALARADLIDEYHLYAHPVLLGDGKPLFPAGIDRQDFELARIKPYANGAIGTTYKRKAVA
jgi:dihydrofolate reductase